MSRRRQSAVGRLVGFGPVETDRSVADITGPSNRRQNSVPVSSSLRGNANGSTSLYSTTILAIQLVMCPRYDVYCNYWTFDTTVRGPAFTRAQTLMANSATQSVFLEGLFLRFQRVQLVFVTLRVSNNTRTHGAHTLCISGVQAIHLRILNPILQQFGPFYKLIGLNN